MVAKTGGIGFVLMLLSCFLVLPVWGLDFQPGEYEVTSKVEMPGMPMPMPPQTTIQCLTKSDPLPDPNAENQNCEVSDMKTKGNTVTWRMVCDQDGTKTESTGSMTYKGDRFEGTVKTKMGPEMGNTTVTVHITGKRIGNCK